MPPFISLEAVEAEDPTVSGAKAAWLSRAARTGLPVLPGLVLTTAESRPHMAIGVDALERRGSGGARLEVSQEPLAPDLAARLVEAAAHLGDPLVVRSSSPLEGGAEWSGAFTSYLEVHPDEVPRAVTGCWASAFGVDTLHRHEATGIEAGTTPMAVLIQPALNPDFGGTARLMHDEVLVVAVAGSPAPLVQGWEPGAQGRVTGDTVDGGAVELMGERALSSVANTLRDAHALLGATACEWAVASGDVILFQLMRPAEAPASDPLVSTPSLATEKAQHLARIVRRYPGALGETLVLPWIMGSPTLPAASRPADVGERRSPTVPDPATALKEAGEHAATLTAEAWGRNKAAAASLAAETLRELRGPDPGAAVERLSALRPPDPERSELVLSLLDSVLRGLVDGRAVTWAELGWHVTPEEAHRLLGAAPGARKRDRIGFDRWEPFTAAVLLARGVRALGTAAAPGVGAGRLCHLPGADTTSFRPRDVIVAPYPTPNLAALLWDAAGLVTTGGGPGAHLFESARALAIPAVCGVDLEDILTGNPAEYALAVDGFEGSVYTTEW